MTPVTSDRDHEDTARILNLPTPTTLTEPARMSELLAHSGRNFIHNGNFSVRQRGSNFVAGGNNDGAYTADRWYILSDGNDIIDVSIGGVQSRIKLDVETANKKFALVQVLEYQDVHQMLNKSVTLSFVAWLQQSGSSLQNVKCALAYQSVAQDAHAHDLIVSWNGNGVNPSLITNWSYLTTPATLALTTSEQAFSITASVPSGATNIAVMVWSDTTTTTVGHMLNLRDFQLELGTQASAFEVQPYALQLATCQRFYEVLRYSSWSAAAVSHYRAASNYSYAWEFKAEKFRAPTVALVTGAWASGTPTIYPGLTTTDFYGTVAFYASGTSGAVALSASAEP